MAGWAETRPRLILALAVLVGLAVTFVLQTAPPSPRKLTLTPVVEAALDARGAPMAGAAAPEVTVVIFTDYRCPVCRKTDPALERLIAADPTVKVVFKDWPILGEQSRLGAQAALAADRQGKYLQMHRALMASAAPIIPQALPQIAREAGVDAERLERDMGTPEIEAQLSRHASQAFGLGLRGTPAYLVGPYLIQGGLDDAALAAAVRRARKAGPPQPE